MLNVQEVFDNNPVFRVQIADSQSECDRYAGLLQKFTDRGRKLVVAAGAYDAALKDVAQGYSELLSAAGGSGACQNLYGEMTLAMFSTINESMSNNAAMMEHFEKRVLQPMLEFKQFMNTLTGTYRKAYEESDVDLTIKQTKFLNSKRKDNKKAPAVDVCNHLYAAKELSCTSTFDYVSLLNDLSIMRDVFIMEKISGIFEEWLRTFPAHETTHTRLSKLHRESKDLFATLALRPYVNYYNYTFTRLQKTPFEKDLAVYRASLGLSSMSSSTSSILHIPVTSEDFDSSDEAISNGHKQGYLLKRHRGARKGWNRRYMYLRQPEGLLMQYSPDKEHTMIADIRNCIVQEVSIDDRSFVFEVSCAPIFQHYLQAENEKEYRQWLTALTATQIGRPREAAPKNLAQTVSRSQGIALSSTQLIHPIIANIKESINLESATGSEEELYTSTNFPAVVSESVLRGLIAVRHSKNPKHLNSGKDLALFGFWRTFCAKLLSSGVLAFEFTDMVGQAFENSPPPSINAKECNSNQISSVHASLFGKLYCFSIRVPNRTIYFSVDTKIEHDTWLVNLKSLARQEWYGNESYRLFRSLFVRIIEGKNLPQNSELYCEVSLDNERCGLTGIRPKSATPFWREDFLFNDIPCLKFGTTVSLIGQSRLLLTQKDVQQGRVYIPMRSMKKNISAEGWYPVVTGGRSNNGSQKSEHIGDLKLKMKYQEHVILKSSEYVRLESLLIDTEAKVYFDLANGILDLEKLADTLVRVSMGRGQAVPWLCSLAENEINGLLQDDLNVLFRGNSLFTKSLDVYQKLVEQDRLEGTVGELIRQICSTKASYEVDPSRLEKGDDLKANWKHLVTLSQKLWNTIDGTKSRCPMTLRQIYGYIQGLILRKFGKKANGKGDSNGKLMLSADSVQALAEETSEALFSATGRFTLPSRSQEDSLDEKFVFARYTSDSGFVFLRLFCPAILNPKLFDLVQEHPEPKAHRNSPC